MIGRLQWRFESLTRMSGRSNLRMSALKRKKATKCNLSRERRNAYRSTCVLRPTRDERLVPANKRIGPKKRKGLESEPLPAKPHFTPSQENLGHHHPGKIKNHFASNSASVLPPIRNSYARLQASDSKMFSKSSPNFPYMNTLNIYNFSQYLVAVATIFGRIQVPMAVRMAEARVSAQRVTSSARSASTMTRALGSVPE